MKPLKPSTLIALGIMGLLFYKFGVAVFATLFILGLIVFIHEFGHYTLMIRNGVKVEEFTVGMGPTLGEWQLKNGTMFRIKLLLVGGYAKPVQTGESSMETASAWAKFKIYMAGMFFNACAAFVAYTVLFYWTWTGPELLIKLTSSIGMPVFIRPVAMGFLASFGLWLSTPYIVFHMLLDNVVTFFQGSAGPVGIIQMGSQAASGGTSVADTAQKLLSFFAMINVALAGFNLMPIQMLDGGRVVELLLLKIPGRIGQAIHRSYVFISLGFILALIIGIFGMDLFRLMMPK